MGPFRSALVHCHPFWTSVVCAYSEDDWSLAACLAARSAASRVEAARGCSAPAVGLEVLRPWVRVRV